ncbi:hypothetical protein BD414DRAFT_480708 [Trametes punicea]|nr:hypothetical protein BD414DRAFT_480708 [Trametes punicea]
MSYNVWPVKAPYWSADILVIPSVKSSVPGGQDSYFHWAIRLMSMKIVKVDKQGDIQDIDNGVLPIGAERMVILDTGASVSYVSPEVIQHMKTSLFNSAETAPGTTELHEGASFIVPDSVASHNLWVEFVFEGREDSAVKVHCPLEPFLCARIPPRGRSSYRQGLLFDNNLLLQLNEWIFGVAMFVALHRPPSPERPYVQLAFQCQGEQTMNQFALPPYEDK